MSCVTSSDWRARLCRKSWRSRPTAPPDGSCDIKPVVEISQRTGLAIECCTFIGSSPLRQVRGRVDGRPVAASDRRGHHLCRRRRARRHVRHRGHDACRSGGVCASFTRPPFAPGPPECVSLTRSATQRRKGRQPSCVSSPAWSRHAAARSGSTGTAIAIAISPSSTRSRRSRPAQTRLHGSAIGIGERVGNTPMDTLLVNLVLCGYIVRDLSALVDYCETVSAATGVPIRQTIRS